MILDISNKIFVINITTLLKQIVILIYTSYQVDIILLVRKKSGIFIKYSKTKLEEYFKFKNYFINIIYNK